MVGKIARNGNVNPRVSEADTEPGKTTPCPFHYFPSGASPSHSAFLRHRCATPVARKPPPIPEKKYFVVSFTRRTSAIDPVLLALGDQTLVALYNALSPQSKPTRQSNVPGYSTSAIPDGGGTLNWRENSIVCARRWRSSRSWILAHSRRRTGRKILGRGVWQKLSWPRLCGVRRGELWRLEYEDCSPEKCAHLPIPLRQPVGTTIGSQLFHPHSVSYHTTSIVCHC